MEEFEDELRSTLEDWILVGLKISNPGSVQLLIRRSIRLVRFRPVEFN
jgi:hypothetical protein